MCCQGPSGRDSGTLIHNSAIWVYQWLVLLCTEFTHAMHVLEPRQQAAVRIQQAFLQYRRQAVRQAFRVGTTTLGYLRAPRCPEVMVAHRDWVVEKVEAESTVSPPFQYGIFNATTNSHPACRTVPPVERLQAVPGEKNRVWFAAHRFDVSTGRNPINYIRIISQSYPILLIHQRSHCTKPRIAIYW